MKVKICGLKTTEQVDTAVTAGADFLGFVFAESKRQVTPEQVKQITINVPRTVKKVGVFVSPTFNKVETIIKQAKLDMVQIHGDLLTDKLSVPMIPALSADGKDKQAIIRKLNSEYILFDAPPEEYAGGNGKTFDWGKINVEEIGNKKLFIAGGLTIANVQLARTFFTPYAVDVSSGVETNGEKDLKKIIAFIQKAKEELDV